MLDGAEDPNGNGAIDAGERDPNDPSDDLPSASGDAGLSSFDAGDLDLGDATFDPQPSSGNAAYSGMGDDGGCACATPAQRRPGGGTGATLGALLGVALLTRRRRRRVAASEPR